jgi:hypothetical protein
MGALDWLVLWATPGPGYPLKRRNMYSFVITIKEWTAVNLDDTTVFECVILTLTILQYLGVLCSEAGEGPSSTAGRSGSSVLGTTFEKDGEMPRWATTSDDISQCCHGPLNSLLWRRDSRLFAAPIRQERCVSHECWNPRRSLPLPLPYLRLRMSPRHIGGTWDCLRPHMRHSCRDVPPERLLTCKL